MSERDDIEGACRGICSWHPAQRTNALLFPCGAKMMRNWMQPFRVGSSAWRRFLKVSHRLSLPPVCLRKFKPSFPNLQTSLLLDNTRQAVAQKTRAWRMATGAMTAIAASLAGFILWTGPVSKPMSPKYVAVLQEDSHTPAFLMTVDMKTHMCAIKSVVSPPKPDKNYQLWMVHDTLEQPRSLGLIAKNDMEVMPMASDIDPDLYMNATFAVSLEPAGGSPTGKPTGPVMYAGRLVQSIP